MSSSAARLDQQHADIGVLGRRPATTDPEEPEVGHDSRGEIPAVKVEVSRKLVEDCGITIAEIARQVGISTSAISKSLARSSS